MGDVACSGTMLCSDGTKIPLYRTDIAQGTAEVLQTSTQSNFTISATAIGTAYPGKTIVAQLGPIQSTVGISYAYLLRAGQIIQIYAVGISGVSSEGVIPTCTGVTLQAGDEVYVMTNSAADRELALSVYTNKGVYHIFAVTPSTGATNTLVSILTSNGIGDTLQGQNVVKAMSTSVDGILLAPSGNGVYVLDDKNNIVGGVTSTNPIKASTAWDGVNIPIGLNYAAQGITSA